MKCVICGNEIVGAPFSAYPIAEGVCCYECYLNSVISTGDKERLLRIAAVDKRMFEKRVEFISKFSTELAKKMLGVVAKYMVITLFYQNEWGLNIRVLRNSGVTLTDKEKEYVAAPFASEASEEFCRVLLKELCKDDETAAKTLMLYAYALYYDDEYRTNWGLLGKDEFGTSEDTVVMYEMLKALGYEISEEEKKWLDGSHVVYTKPKEQEDED